MLKFISDVRFSFREWAQDWGLRWRYPRSYWTIIGLHQSLKPDRLREVLRRAGENYELVGISEGMTSLRQKKLHRPLLTLTYDDADRSVYDEAFPIHRELKVPACLYVCTGFIEQGLRHTKEASRPTMSWAQIREWSDAGLEVGAHTVNHIPLNQASLPRAEKEIIESVQELEERLGTRILHFAYPWGIYTDELARWLQEESALASVATTIEADNYPPATGKHLFRKTLPPDGFDWKGRLPERSFYHILRQHHYRRVLNGQAPLVFRENPMEAKSLP